MIDGCRRVSVRPALSQWCSEFVFRWEFILPSRKGCIKNTVHIESCGHRPTFKTRTICVRSAHGPAKRFTVLLFSFLDSENSRSLDPNPPESSPLSALIRGISGLAQLMVFVPSPTPVGWCYGIEAADDLCILTQTGSWTAG